VRYRHRSVTLTEPSWGGQKNDYDKYILGYYQATINIDYWSDYLVNYEIQVTAEDTGGNTATVKQKVDGVLAGALKAIVSAILAVLKAAWDAAMALVDFLIEWIKEQIESMINPILNIFTNISNKIMDAYVSFLLEFIDFLHGFESLTGEEDAWQILVILFNKISFFSEIFEKINNFINTLTTIVNFAEPFLNLINPVGFIMGIVMNKFTSSMGFVNDLLNKVTNTVESIADTIISSIFNMIIGPNGFVDITNNLADISDSDLPSEKAILNFMNVIGISFPGLSIVFTIIDNIFNNGESKSVGNHLSEYAILYKVSAIALSLLGIVFNFKEEIVKRDQVSQNYLENMPNRNYQWDSTEDYINERDAMYYRGRDIPGPGQTQFGRDSVHAEQIGEASIKPREKVKDGLIKIAEGLICGLFVTFSMDAAEEKKDEGNTLWYGIWQGASLWFCYQSLKLGVNGIIEVLQNTLLTNGNVDWQEIKSPSVIIALLAGGIDVILNIYDFINMFS